MNKSGLIILVSIFHQPAYLIASPRFLVLTALLIRSAFGLFFQILARKLERVPAWDHGFELLRSYISYFEELLNRHFFDAVFEVIFELVLLLEVLCFDGSMSLAHLEIVLMAQLPSYGLLKSISEFIDGKKRVLGGWLSEHALGISQLVL